MRERERERVVCWIVGGVSCSDFYAMPKTRSKPENLLNKIITKMTREKALTAFSTARKNLYPSIFDSLREQTVSLYGLLGKVYTMYKQIFSEHLIP